MTFVPSIKILRFILIFFIIHVSHDLLSQDSDSLKCWSENHKLTWNDFKGKNPEIGENSHFSALTNYRLIALPFRTGGLLSYRVKLIFKKYESWTTDTTTQYMLSHEQLHFDIAELYARKLRNAIREVSETIQQPTANDFEPVIKKLYVENADMQREYDEDTIHGLDEESQKEWTKKICLELEQLKDYASKPVDCK